MPSHASSRLRHPKPPLLIEAKCPYPGHREEGLDWCRIPRQPYERLALCGVCHPNPFDPLPWRPT